ncbi:hypothetical protein JZ751_007248 [Albula glossodonta]|uniref:Uncharacterized protein n=1 Tax=Albula glossodonta TaxID=121402 RepID=A0A8T2N3F7_9TELE|nr:hypothetical protein JZ751_007248 [Albula glossodonta]
MTHKDQRQNVQKKNRANPGLRDQEEPQCATVSSHSCSIRKSGRWVAAVWGEVLGWANYQGMVSGRSHRLQASLGLLPFT